MGKIFNTLNDDGKLKQRFYNKRVNAAKEGIPFELTAREFMMLMIDAGVVSSDLGIKKHHLARKADRGPYRYGNCRFVWYLDNYKEKWDRLGHQQRPPKMSWQEYLVLRQTESKKRAKARFKNAHPSYRGNRNSQFGSCWITNGRVNKKWSSDKMPKGFRKGRV